MNKTAWIAIAAVLIVIGLALVLTYSAPSSAPQQQAGSSVLAVLLTDPPQVPASTQSLIIYYSSLQVHLSNAGNESGWVSSTGSGSVDLISVINLSQTLGTVTLPANATINMVRFNVDRATITINGTVHNVTVPSGMVTAHVTGKNKINSSSSVLVDFSPVVASIITNNSTVYVLVPSLRAVVVGGATASANQQVGARVHLSEDDIAELENIRSNLSITGASLSVTQGNVTHFSITVKDASNQSVVIRHAGFRGNLSVKFNTSLVQERIQEFINNTVNRVANSSYCAMVNASTHGGSNTIVGGRTPLNHTFNISMGDEVMLHINSTLCTPAGLAAFKSRLESMAVNASTRIESEQRSDRLVIFAIGGNGTLTVPSGEDEFENSGYTLQAGQSATLSFNGVINPGEGRLVIAPISGDQYMVGAQIEDAGIIAANVTAT